MVEHGSLRDAVEVDLQAGDGCLQSRRLPGWPLEKRERVPPHPAPGLAKRLLAGPAIRSHGAAPELVERTDRDLEGAPRLERQGASTGEKRRELRTDPDLEVAAVERRVQRGELARRRPPRVDLFESR